MSRVILFNKPWGVLSQFTDAGGRATLADHIPLHGLYAAGRLDRDSEGLLVLTDDGALQHRLADPRHKVWKTYRVQVEGLPDEAALQRLRDGVELNDGPTRPALVRRLALAEPWPRVPPIRVRRSIPDCWLEIHLREGRNRQVRRMTAAVGHPTLRLIRWALGDWTLTDLAPAAWRWAEVPAALASDPKSPRGAATGSGKPGGRSIPVGHRRSRGSGFDSRRGTER